LERRNNGRSSGPNFAGIGLQDARVLGPPESPPHLQAHKPQPPVEEPTPEPDERAPVKEPDRPIPDRRRSGRDDNAALVRSVLLQRGAAAGRRLEVSGGIMNEGMKRCCYGLRQLPLIALAFGLPAFSMTSELAVEPPAPSISQCALIEVHDTAGIGWWSSAALEIDPAVAVYSGD
jgi:hypothetical protein